MPAKPAPTDGGPRRRADAERSIARILDAAVDALAEDQDASMAAIARRAGVVRATIYVHFPTRELLIDSVTERAVAEVSTVIAEAQPDQGTPEEALRRVLEAAWRQLGRFHALVAVSMSTRTADQMHRLHAPVVQQLAPLIERGQASGAFRADAPARWHLAMLMAIIHAASGEVRAGRIPDPDAESAVIATVLGALSEH
jgi:TetR/AcrR family transcriptional regulator, mexCD-oprJ operon repressor